MNISGKIWFVTILFCLLLALAACPTAYNGLPTLDDFLADMIEAKLNGKIVSIMEAENGTLVHIGPWGAPEKRYDSGVASGGAYVKEISLYHGYVEVTVPDTVPGGNYSLALGWSGSSSGIVKVTVNAGKSDENSIEMIFSRAGDDWEMKDPQYLVVLENTPFKPGDTIRVHSGVAGLSGTPANYSGGHINLDAVYLFTANAAETE